MRSEPTDAMLIHLVLSGDRQSFARLVERHRRKVFSAAMQTLGDRELAEDVTQEAFVKAYRSLEAYSPTIARFETWLLTIAARTAVDAQRRRRRTESLEHITEAQGFDPPSQARPEASSEAESVSEAVHRALRRLPERQRLAVTLKHLQELPFTEVARIMGCSVNSAKVHAHRGRVQLAKYLGHIREELTA